MSLADFVIDGFGGYEKAKAVLDNPNAHLLHNIEGLKQRLLEYRRANRIFENGDLIVYPWMDDKIHKYNAQYIIKSPWRHATDAEIATGKRLEVD
ncbi:MULTISPECIES: hypothetical protein [unclassified Acinetobacter]|uniref:hypothetical protein n=1 Tax=unclassified Acinetobacter TaxID=196816 RepID=UPI0015D142EC|nr:MULTISPECIES: hypothetical protein [unclassified Acinetobacter]